MTDCLFCKIAQGEVPADIVYDDGSAVAFRDINPQAPLHILIIPRAHLTNLAAASGADAELLGNMLLLCPLLAAQEGVAETGYRVVLNVGPDGGQSVDHLHVHLLGGRRLTWPPG